MKNQLFFLLFILFSSGIFAQQTPAFEFSLCFEDAVGNKDTVILGYDANATNGIDATFGENDILNQPWGNSLDVRIGDKIYETTPQTAGPAVDYWPITWIKDSNSYLSKKQILNYSCNKLNSDTVSIQFSIADLPVSISWNGDLFQNQCVGMSGLYGGQLWRSSDMSNGIAFGMPGKRTIEIKKKLGTDSLSVFPAGSTFPWFPIATYMNGADSIGVLHFIFGSRSSSGLTKNNFNTLSFYPNPVKNVLNIKGLNNTHLKFCTVRLYSLDGRLQTQKRMSKDNQQFDVSQLNRGVYLVKVYKPNGTLFKISKLIKK